MITPYTPAIEESMKAHYKRLNEKEKRSYAAVEAEKLPYGGKTYIVRLFKCSPNRIKRGLKELKEEKNKGIRLSGGGAKGKLANNPDIEKAFEKVVETYTAGSPVKEGVNWTNLKPSEIMRKMKEEEQIETTVYIVKQIIYKKSLGKRKLHKGKTLKTVEGRNEQFENIKNIKEKATAQGNPVISVDTKKKGANVRIC